MNIPTMVVVLSFLFTSGLLVYLAMWGNPWAITILAVLSHVTCLVLGYRLSSYQSEKQAERAQDNFITNAKENLALMAGLQRAQNLQNRGIQQQVQTLTKLPEPSEPNGAFVIQEGIFDHLGEE